MLISVLVAVLAAGAYGAVVASVLFDEDELKVPRQSDVAVARATTPGAPAACGSDLLVSAVEARRTGPGKFVLATDEKTADRPKKTTPMTGSQACSYFVTVRGPLAAALAESKPVMRDGNVVAIKGDGASGLEATFTTGDKGGFVWSGTAGGLQAADAGNVMVRAPVVFRFADLHGPSFDPYTTYGGLVQAGFEFTDAGVTTTLPAFRSGWKVEVTPGGNETDAGKTVSWSTNPAKYQVKLTNNTPPSQLSQVGASGWVWLGSILLVFGAVLVGHTAYTGRYRRAH